MTIFQPFLTNFNQISSGFYHFLSPFHQISTINSSKFNKISTKFLNSPPNFWPLSPISNTIQPVFQLFSLNLHRINQILIEFNHFEPTHDNVNQFKTKSHPIIPFQFRFKLHPPIETPNFSNSEQKVAIKINWIGFLRFQNSFPPIKTRNFNRSNWIWTDSKRQFWHISFIRLIGPTFGSFFQFLANFQTLWMKLVSSSWLCSNLWWNWLVPVYFLPIFDHFGKILNVIGQFQLTFSQFLTIFERFWVKLTNSSWISFNF